MSELRISRRQMLGAGGLGTLALVLAPSTAFADGQVELLRWDLVTITSGVILAGGTDVAKDAATGDTVALTGSGQARPDEGSATGGGTFVHRKADGSVFAQGVYFVTGFNSFKNAGGSLVGIPLTDGIGRLAETTGGVLSLGVRLLPAGGSPHDAVLGVDCELPGSTPVTEGVTLSVGPFNFVQDTGATLFHILED